MFEEAGNGRQRQVIRVAAYSVLGLAVFVGLPEAARWMNGGAFAQSGQTGLPQSNAGIIAPGNQGIITQGQTGGTNQIVNQAPPPQVHVTSNATTPNGNGTFTQTLTIDIVSDRTLPRLIVVAKKPNALRVEVTGGVRFQIRSGSGEGFVFYQFQNASGTYTVTIIKSSDAPAEISYEL